jgi:mitochondrial fission protein ELM1
VASQRILIVSDGLGGHDRSSYGILAALKKYRCVEAVLLPVEERRGKSRRLKRALARLLPFGPFWNNFYRVGKRLSPANPVPAINAVPERPIDLVVSTGPATAAANIALARHFGAKNIYFGFPEFRLADGFTLLLCPAAPQRGANVAYALRPSELDAAALPEARAIGEGGEERTAALLIGGDSRHYTYAARDMDILAERLADLSAAMPWLRWTVFDSRRTPKRGLQRFAEILARSAAPIDVVRYSEAGLLSNSAAFKSDLVLVTADSMSMISESVAARRPTGILFPDDYQASRRDRLEHELLTSKGTAFELKFSALEAKAIMAALPGIRLMAESQLDILFRTIECFGI